MTMAQRHSGTTAPTRERPWASSLASSSMSPTQPSPVSTYGSPRGPGDEASTPHVGDIELLSPSPRKSPSVAAAIAAFETGGKKNNQIQQNHPLPTLPADMEEAVIPSPTIGASATANDTAAIDDSASTPLVDFPDLLPSSPPLSPSTPPRSSPTTPKNAASGNNNVADDQRGTQEDSSERSSSPGKLPFVKILEVENELRKREHSMSFEEMEEVAEDDDDDDDDEENDGTDVGAAIMSLELSEASERDGALQNMIQVSDSEQDDVNYEEDGHYEEQDEEEEEWEDFMANYWQLSPSTSNAVTPQQAKSITANEDTDLKPCAMEPQLDEDPNALSPIRTGCMDIDMDFTAGGVNESNGVDWDGMNHLSEVGLECSSAMAQIIDTWGEKSEVGMGSLRIDVGKIESRRTPTRKKRSPRGQSTLSQMEIIDLAKEHASHLPAAAAAETTMMTASPSTPQEASDMHSSSQDLKLMSTPTRSFDTRSDAAGSSATDAIDKKSTRSTIGSETASIVGVGSSEAQDKGVGTDWKHKTSPLPDPELIHMAGPILTRTSLRALVMKKWHPSYWMHYGPHTLLIFRSKEHMDDWRYNPYHGKKQRDFLVKLEIDFMGDLDKQEQGQGQTGGNSGKEAGILGHRVLPVKKKSYGKKEEETYQFKLERWTNLGCSVLAAFGSQEEDEVQILHDTITGILKCCPNNGLRNIEHMLK